jgi:polyisoprenyl-phosphate glycosyltransferase
MQHTSIRSPAEAGQAHSAHAPFPARRLHPAPSLSCILPAYNEASNLRLVVPDTLAVLGQLSEQVEVVVVDDGSTDDTALVMHGLCAVHPQLIYLQLSRNFGKEAALTAGLDIASGAVIVMMDADGQHPSNLLAPMLAKWKGGADVVYAMRTTRSDQSALQGWLTGLFYMLINWHARVTIPADAGDFRLMDRKVVDALKQLPERNRFMKGLYAWVGFRSEEIDYVPMVRNAGASKFGFRRATSLALTGMLAFSTAPLRLTTWLGLILSLGSIGFGLWEVIEYFANDQPVPGYATIVVGMMFLSGMQLLAIGVLAEYIGRIYDEVKRRPTYLVTQRTGAGLSGCAER